APTCHDLLPSDRPPQVPRTQTPRVEDAPSDVACQAPVSVSRWEVARPVRSGRRSVSRPGLLCGGTPGCGYRRMKGEWHSLPVGDFNGDGRPRPSLWTRP